jgi:murein L,D-transpeptidase YcbB/YkuD
MVSREWSASASRLASVVVLKFLIAASAASAAPLAPLRAALVEAPSPLVQQLAVVRKREPERESDIFAPGFVSPLVPFVGAREIVSAPAPAVDIADALVTDEQREFAAALASWTGATKGAERLRQRKAIAAVYAQRGYLPFWRDGDRWRAEAASVAERLAAAGEDGLDLRAYSAPSLAEGTASLSGELDLAEAVVAYAVQAAGGRIDPQRLSRLIGARPPLPEPGAILTRVAAAGALAGDELQDFNPPHPGYRALKEKLGELRSAGLPAKDLRFAALRTAARDDAAPPLRHRRPALAPKLGNARLEAEIIANMERWRWLPREMGETRIEVNIPDFELAVVRGGVVTHRARVIVGKEKTPTPVFSNEMRYIIVNPYWNVPPSILDKEMLPKYGGNLEAIAASGYEVIYRKGRPIVRQKPGEGNALGRIKFMFPNDFSVYLHDTPSRGLFASAHRAFSHGCVRVDQPFRLAEAVLGPGSGWPEARVRKLVGGSERYINLTRPLPIHIEYFTAFVDDQGRLQLRADLYGYSARVRAALGLNG